MRWFISIFIVLALVAGLWWLEQRRQAELSPQPRVDVPAEPEQPEPRYPLPQPEQQPTTILDDPSEKGGPETRQQPDGPAPEPRPPLPDLAESDEAALDALSSLLGGAFVDRWVKTEFVVPRTVAVINSLDGSAPALKTRSLNTLDSEPRTEPGPDGDTLYWSQANAERYDALITAVETVSPEAAAALYARFYPLFQQAWSELGETEPHFNDRLIDVIDHLLATPQVEAPLEVVPHEGRLHFADETLQQESWGRKLLMRMGQAHADPVRDWLTTFRRAVLRLPDGTEPARDLD